ncbi:hypothetical protein TIFTF001_054828 [Ficus carica]|uniref:LysM domain-containing protein n=1 Tax=Ficus carica TaxID=3494 RepID=A0AA88EH62_FICCA|nr:hypothetical protein TIFTF001_054828 [Ficus carica]
MARKFSIIGHAISWWCALALASILILASLNCNTNASRLKGFHKFKAPTSTSYGVSLSTDFTRNYVDENNDLTYEYLEVQEGDTLYSIMKEYGDPDVLENNPHIIGVEYLIPGLLIKVADYRKLEEFSKY